MHVRVHSHDWPVLQTPAGSVPRGLQGDFQAPGREDGHLGQTVVQAEHALLAHVPTEEPGERARNRIGSGY